MRNQSNRTGLLLCMALALGLGAGRGTAAMVFGNVFDATQSGPVPGVWVYLRHAPTKQADSVRTDSAGAYGFPEASGCESGCGIEVRVPEFWPYVSESFTLSADGIKQIDVGLQRVHALSIQVFKAEDTTEAVPYSQAVVFSSENEPPRCEWADSAGRMTFKDLQSLTGYLVTVSAPGRKAFSSMMHFHYPVINNFLRVRLSSDTAGTDKSLHGVLSAQGAGPAVGERIVLSCRNEWIAADLFGITGQDGGYSIAGVPAACDSVMLYAGRDSAVTALTATENQLDWSAEFPLPASLGPGRARRARAASPGAPWRGYDLAGRKLNAVRARSRP